jgi:hypothetical protein
VRALEQALGTIRKEWDSLPRKDQFQRLEALAARIRAASPNEEVSGRIAKLTDSERFDGDAGDIEKLAKAIEVIAESGAP